VSYIGAPVEYTNLDDVYDGRLVEEKNQVRWILSTGQTLVYDYFTERWGEHALRIIDPQCRDVVSNEIVDACNWRGHYTMLRSNGFWYWRDPSSFEYTYADENCGIPLEIFSSWIKMDPLLGWQRFRRVGFIGDFHGQCRLTVEVYYDFDEYTVHQTVEFEITAAVLAEPPPHQFRFRLNRQKCQAIMLRIVDSNWSGDVEKYNGYSLSGWELEVGMKPGISKMRQERTLGS
jgi:hypothetical protein